MDGINHSGTRVFEMPRGARVTARRLRRSMLTKIVEAVGAAASPEAALVRTVELAVRASVVGAEGLTHPDTGAPLAYAAEAHKLLGSLATTDVYDALDDATVLAVAAWARTSHLTEDEEKKSGTPPGSSAA